MPNHILSTDLGVPTPLTTAVLSTAATGSFVWLMEGVTALSGATNIAAMVLADGQSRVRIDGDLVSIDKSGLQLGLTNANTGGHNTVNVGAHGSIQGGTVGIDAKWGGNTLQIAGSVMGQIAGVQLGQKDVPVTDRQTLTLAQGGSILGGIVGILDRVGGSVLRIDGTVSASSSTGLSSDGIQMGNQSKLTVGETGVVAADHAISAGAGTSIVNLGEISGTFGVIFDGSTTRSSTLINRGEISGSLQAILSGQALHLVNTGAITGAVIAQSSAVAFSGSTIVNRGVIDGDVSLGAGNDSYTGVGGRVGTFVLGLGGDDRLTGGTGDDTLSGGAGNDVLHGRGGDDTLIKEDNDLTGADTFDGGGDTDVLEVRGGSAATVDLNSGTLVLGGTTNSLSQIEDITTGAGNDRLTGDESGNSLSAQAGDDTLLGQAGNDTLAGGDGLDRLLGGEGRDVMAGGAGADQFVFTNLADSGPAAATRDVISDFTDFTSGLADRDRIILTAIDANTTLAGDQAFVSIASGAFVDGSSAGKVRFTQTAGGTLIEMEVDDDGVADMSILLMGTHTIISADYAL